MLMPQIALRIHLNDTIVVALVDLSIGQKVSVGETQYTIAEAIPAKHKFATCDFAVGDTIIMYGIIVGKATQAISVGGLISTANTVHAISETRIKKTAEEPNELNVSWIPPNVEKWSKLTFDGFHREDGSVGTANYWIVVPLVFCENRNLAVMKEAFLKHLGYASNSPYENFVQALTNAHKEGLDVNSIPDIEEVEEITSNLYFPNVDGIKFLSHSFGCAQSNNDSDSIAQLLAGYITNPNVAGVTVLSLGCQKTQFSNLQAEIDKRDSNFSKPIYFFEQQKIKSEKAMLSQAMRQTFLGLVEANQLQREPASLSKLTIGLECGGSDGFSGITANPVFGKVSDILATIGGSAILAEFPELCGVEQNIVDRCVSTEKAERFLTLMKLYAESAAKVGASFDQNPSFGNIADGLITDAIKSAGAARKGGTSPVIDVLDYTEKVTLSGLNLLCTPGNDVESTTALAGSGANIILFSTGLGTPTGNPICPVIKVSTNTKMASALSDLIDYDAGPIINQGKSIEELADGLLALIIEVASGRCKTKAMLLDQDDFIPWRRGVSL